jgi:plastocyanin
MKKLIALVATGAVAAVIAVPALAATKTVTVSDNYFVRKGPTPTVTIHKGDSVHWVWKGKHAHQVFQVAGPGHFHFPPTAKVKAQFTHRFTQKGTYSFIDPHYATMKMNVKVK